VANGAQHHDGEDDALDAIKANDVRWSGLAS